eukprot:468567-Prorocentrum_minimum.AAC.1
MAIGRARTPHARSYSKILGSQTQDSRLENLAAALKRKKKKKTDLNKKKCFLNTRKNSSLQKTTTRYARQDNRSSEQRTQTASIKTSPKIPKKCKRVSFETSRTNVLTSNYFDVMTVQESHRVPTMIRRNFVNLSSQNRMPAHQEALIQTPY